MKHSGVELEAMATIAKAAKIRSLEDFQAAVRSAHIHVVVVVYNGTVALSGGVLLSWLTLWLCFVFCGGDYQSVLITAVHQHSIFEFARGFTTRIHTHCFPPHDFKVFDFASHLLMSCAVPPTNISCRWSSTRNS